MIATSVIAIYAASLSTLLALFTVGRELRERRERKIKIRSAAVTLLRWVERTVEGPQQAYGEAATVAGWTEADILHIEQLGAQRGGRVLKLVEAIASDLRWMRHTLGEVDFGLIHNNFPWPDFQARRTVVRDRLMVLETLAGGQPRGWITPSTIRRTVSGKSPLG
jgi:hypothetical protein